MCPPLGVVAWSMGSADLKEMDAGTMDNSGRSITNAGRILGMIGTLMLALVAVLVFAIFVIFASL